MGEGAWMPHGLHRRVAFISNDRTRAAPISALLHNSTAVFQHYTLAATTPLFCYQGYEVLTDTKRQETREEKCGIWYKVSVNNSPLPQSHKNGEFTLCSA